MAIFNEILVGRFNRWAQKLAAIKGTAPLRQLGGEMMPIIDAEVQPVETRILANWSRYYAGLNAPAVAAQNSVVHVRNPVISGMLAVLERIVWTQATAGPVALNMGFQKPGVDATNVFTGLPIDPRQPTGRSILIVSSGNNIAQFGNSTFIDLNNGAAIQIRDIILDPNHEIPIPPGITWQFTPSGTVNDNFLIGFFWRERPIEESELIG